MAIKFAPKAGNSDMVVDPKTGKLIKLDKKMAVPGGVATITKQQGKQPEEVVHQKFPDMIVDKPMCNIGVQAGQTINTGNYSAVKIGVSLNMPCHVEELEDTYAFARHWVDTKMIEMVDGLGLPGGEA